MLLEGNRMALEKTIGIRLNTEDMEKLAALRQATEIPTATLVRSLIRLAEPQNIPTLRILAAAVEEGQAVGSEG
jgi:hypothetical protein